MFNFSSPLLEWLPVPDGTIELAELGTFDVEAFQIAKYPITNAQFDLFVADGGYKNRAWWTDLAVPVRSPRASDWREPDAPKLQVAWFEAVAFCRWLLAQLDATVRLPTEWEWQWAAGGEAGVAFSAETDSTHYNIKESAIGRTNLVTQFAEVATPFGATDMIGNVWEWCLNEGKSPSNIHVEGVENRALRGGAWNTPQKKAQLDFRSHRTPRTRVHHVGFRPISLPI